MQSRIFCSVLDFSDPSHVLTTEVAPLLGIWLRIRVGLRFFWAFLFSLRSSVLACGLLTSSRPSVIRWHNKWKRHCVVSTLRWRIVFIINWIVPGRTVALAWYKTLQLLAVLIWKRCSGESVPGRQPKFYNPIPRQPGVLHRWQGCRSSCYKSMNC